MPGHCIAFVNMKGGVGKTTLAVGVAWELAQSHSVLLIDCDPQFNATQWLADDNDYLNWIRDPAKRTLLDIFVPRVRPPSLSRAATRKAPAPADLKNAVMKIQHGRTRLDLVPSTLRLMELDSPSLGTEQTLKKFVRKARAKYDFIVLDLPPTVGLFTLAGYLACDSYLIPVKPDPLSRIGLPLLEHVLGKYQQKFEHDAKMLGVVLTLVRGTAAMRTEKLAVRTDNPGVVFKDELKQTTGVSEAVDKGVPLQMYAKARREVGKKLTAITDEIVRRIDDEGT